jgi:Secretion system C-terminal sorting domain
MKHIFSILLWATWVQLLISQNKYDYNWVSSFSSGGNLLNFSGDSLNMEAIGPNISRTSEALACMSGKTGDFLFYTNNCTIFNKKYAVMENGEGLNPGQIQAYWCNVNPWSNPQDNSVLILPRPGDDNRFDVFHWDYESFLIGSPGSGYNFGPLHFYYTTVDMSQNNGLGKVIFKNNIIIEDTLNNCALQAVRHANGRDWWLLIPEFNGNCYYKVLFDPSGPNMMDKQCIGTNWGKYATGSAEFGVNGTRYVRCDGEYGLNVFDFDRCDGQLSNAVHVPIDSPGTYPLDCMSLSPSGRFAYHHYSKKIFQYDLEAVDIGASKILVATYDGFVSSGNATDFYKSQLAPDGKIYICTSGPTYYWSVIEHPDSLGLACEVKQHSIQLPKKQYAAMPNFPNYRIGALSGPCDTISTGLSDMKVSQKQLIVAPNPSTGDFDIILPEGETLQKIELFDLAGKLVYTQIVDKFNQKPTHYHLSNGFYLLKAIDKNEHHYINRIIVE